TPGRLHLICHPLAHNLRLTHSLLQAGRHGRMANFTAEDIFSILRVTPFFALIFLAPGYCLGRVSNVLGFRQRGAAEQWLLSTGISIVVMPITLNFLSRWFPLGVTVP